MIAAMMTPAGRVVGERVWMAIRRDRMLAATWAALAVGVVALVIAGVTAWRGSATAAPAVAVALGSMPALVAAMLYVTGPLTRDEATGATRTLVSAAVAPGEVARATRRVVALPWVALGGVGGLVVAIQRAGVGHGGAGPWPLLLTAAVIGPLAAYATVRLAVALALLIGTEAALVPVWVVLVIAVGGVVVVATGLVTASWPLLGTACVVAACVRLGVWAADGELTATRLLRG